MTEQYFAHTASGRDASSVGSYTAVDRLVPLDAGPGVVVRVVPGRQLLLSHVTVAPHGVAPVHTHDEEQLGLVLSGSAEMDLDGVSRTLRAGDIYLAPPGVPHGLIAGADGCVVADLFAPPRAALLALLAAGPPERAE